MRDRLLPRELQLAALHWSPLGERVATDSADVEEAFALFTDVWRQRHDVNASRLCDWPADLFLNGFDTHRPFK